MSIVALLVGIAIGAAAAVISPKVYEWVKSKLGPLG